MSEQIGGLYRITDAGAKALSARNSVTCWTLNGSGPPCSSAASQRSAV